MNVVRISIPAELVSNSVYDLDHVRAASALVFSQWVHFGIR